MPRDPVVDAGAAWFDLGNAPLAGGVCAVFRRAVYLRVGGRIVAVGSGAIPPGPLHLRLRRFSPAAVAVGDRVTFAAGRLQVGGLALRLRAEHRWDPPAADVAGLLERAGRRAPPWPVAEAVDDAGVGLPPGVLAAAARAVATGDLSAAAAGLAGLGPGLTPAGDDVLAGILVVAALLGPPGVSRHREAFKVAEARTNDVAAAFLRWAAIGQTIGPAHRVLSAMAAGDDRSEAAARAGLMRVGASSGTALLIGINLGLAAWPGALHGAATVTQPRARRSEDATRKVPPPWSMDSSPPAARALSTTRIPSTTIVCCRSRRTGSMGSPS